MSTMTKARETSAVWHWSECQDRRELKAIWPRQEPRQPRVGEGWYDEHAGALFVWDGDEWVSVPED